MGKARVYQHLGNGLYSILYQPDKTYALARLAELQQLKADLDTQYNAAEVGLLAAQSAALAAHDAASAAFYSALDAWAVCARQQPPCSTISTLLADLNRAAAERIEAGSALSIINAAVASNRAQYLSAVQEIAYLNTTANTGADGVLMQAYCVDYDSDKLIPDDAEVGTIETFGAKGGYAGGYLPRKWINIKSSASAGYSAAVDHCIVPISSQPTAAMFFNWCQWLYVMSRNPAHAVGVVLSKFSETQTYLDVQLLGTTPGASQPAGYPFVRGESSITLLNVPVEYLECGAELFSEGDYVVVRFSGINRADPTVIGFAQNPVECRTGKIAISATWPTGTSPQIRFLNYRDCSNDITIPPATIADNDISALDWIDADGVSQLWCPCPIRAGLRRYAFELNSVTTYTLFQRAGSHITVAAPIRGFAIYAGVVIYAAKTSTHWQIRTTDETVIGSIALSALEDESATSTDGWLKFNGGGSIGIMLLSSLYYLRVDISGSGGAIAASFSVVECPGSYDILKTEIDIILAPDVVIMGSCVDGAALYKQWQAHTKILAIDFVADEIKFLFRDDQTYIYNYPWETYYDHRRAAISTCVYRLTDSSGGADFEMADSLALLSRNVSWEFAFTPDLSDQIFGDVIVTDIDLRRRSIAAYIEGVRYTISTAGAAYSAHFMHGDKSQVVEFVGDVISTEVDPAPSEALYVPSACDGYSSFLALYNYQTLDAVKRSVNPFYVPFGVSFNAATAPFIFAFTPTDSIAGCKIVTDPHRLFRFCSTLPSADDISATITDYPARVGFYRV